MIKYCKNCLNPSTRPNTYFSKEGLCPVCIFEKKKSGQKINWLEREKEILKIKKWGQKNTKNSYDCIVTISGGKDSMRQAFYARDNLGMNPLLVSSLYPPEHMHERGARNISNLINHGFDCISLSLDPIKWKELLRHGLFKFGNFARACEMALYAIPIHIAIAHKIPLLFYGENPVLTIGEKHGRTDGNALKIQEANTIKGGPKGLKFSDLTDNDAYFYEYPSYKEIKQAKLKIVYLGYYIKDWYGFKNAELAIKQGLEVRSAKPNEIGDLWGFSALDDDFTMVNQHLKYLKFGFGRVTDQVCEAIHQGMLTREDAVKLVKKYDGRCSKKYIKLFCKYLEITEQAFWTNVDKNVVNKKLFKKVKNNWVPKFKVQ